VEEAVIETITSP